MRLIKGLAISAVVLLLVLGVVPLVGKWYVQHWLEQKGVTAVVKQFGVNIFLGRITVGSASLSKSGQEHAGVFLLELDFSIPELLQGRVVLDKLTSDNLNFSVGKEGDYWAVAGMPMSQWLGAAGGEGHISIKRLESKNTDICTTDREQCLRIEELYTGRIDWRRQQDQWSFSHASPLVVNKVFLQDRSNSSSVFFLENLDVQQSQYSNSATTLQSLNLRNMQMVESETLPSGQKETPYQTQIGELNVDSVNLSYSDKAALKLRGVNVVSLRQSMERQKVPNRRWPGRIQRWFPQLYQLLQGISLDGSGATAINLKDFEVQGGNFTWRDNTVIPPAIEHMNEIKFTVDHIDSQAKGESQLVFHAKLGDIGAIDFKSTARFFEGAPLFDIAGFVHGLDLGNIAGYSDVIFNQRITEGVIDASFEVGASGGQAAGRSTWRLTGLNTEGARVSMHQAFIKLADHNNSVEFELPIGLTLGEELGPVVMLGRAVSNTLTQKARGIKVNPNTVVERPVPLEQFAPIYFATNSVTPADLDLPRVPEMAKELRARPGKSLVICPVATAGEWAILFNNGVAPGPEAKVTEGQQQKLIALTKQRGATLNRLFTQQGIAPSRIILCGPSVDMNQTGPSLATIAI